MDLPNNVLGFGALMLMVISELFQFDSNTDEVVNTYGVSAGLQTSLLRLYLT